MRKPRTLSNLYSARNITCNYTVLEVNEFGTEATVEVEGMTISRQELDNAASELCKLYYFPCRFNSRIVNTGHLLKVLKETAIQQYPADQLSPRTVEIFKTLAAA